MGLESFFERDDRNVGETFRRSSRIQLKAFQLCQKKIESALQHIHETETMNYTQVSALAGHVRSEEACLVIRLTVLAAFFIPMSI